MPATVVTTAPQNKPQRIPVGWPRTVTAQSRSQVRPLTRGLIVVRPLRSHNHSLINRTYLPSTSANLSSTVSPVTPSPNSAVQHQPVKNFMWTPPVVVNERQTTSDSIAEDVLYAPPPLPNPRKKVPRMLSIGSPADSATIKMAKVNKCTYSCRLCGRPFHNINDLIGIYSDEGRRLQIDQMILYTLSILVSVAN